MCVCVCASPKKCKKLKATRSQDPLSNHLNFWSCFCFCSHRYAQNANTTITQSQQSEKCQVVYTTCSGHFISKHYDCHSTIKIKQIVYQQNWPFHRSFTPHFLCMSLFLPASGVFFSYNSVRSCRLLRLLSAGPWSPGPPVEWWHWSSPIPQLAAPVEKPVVAPAPSAPMRGESESSWCPPMLACWVSAVYPVSRGNKKVYFSDYYYKGLRNFMDTDM